MSKGKCNENAIVSRTEGNKLYSERRFHKSLLKYNESLCLAEPQSENVGLAYANRSAIYFEMKLYGKCLSNIDLARKNNYPEKSIEILTKREEKCRALLKNERKGNGNLFKLSYSSNKNLQFIIECLELREDEKFGRHIVTNKNLKVGDIVAIEKPFCSVLISESKFVKVPESNLYQRCSNCLKDNALDLIPCSTCSHAMFCSTDCFEIAFKRFHRFECSVMDRLIKSGSVHMALRIFFIALSTFNGRVEELKDFVMKNDKSTVFDLNGKLDEIENEKIRLIALISLSRSSKTFSLVQHEKIIKNHLELKKIWETEQDFIRNFLQRQCQISDHNFHGIFSGSTIKEESFDPKTVFNNLQQSIGSGSMLFCSLINHSCSSNVLRVCFEGKIAVVVCRPIAEGSQLFDCYNANFIKQPKADRQAKLLQEFGFVCDCEACSKNFPTPPALSFKDVKLLNFANKADSEILKLPQNQAYKKFRDCCELLEKNHQDFPSVELFILQKCIISFLLGQARPSFLFS